MEFIKGRPSLPLKFQLGSLPPVQKPLHSDDSMEVYLLGCTGGSDLVLIRCPSAIMHAMQEWWHLLGLDLITELPDDCRSADLCAIQIHGRWLCDNQIAEMEEGEWGPFLLASVQLMEMAFQHHLRPSFSASLLWFSARIPVLIPACAVLADQHSEADILHDFAAVLLSSATGIDREALSSDVGKLRPWNRCIPSDLLGVLADCLPKRNSQTITSFAEFRNKMLGGPRVSKGSAGGTSQASGKQGLSNVAGMADLKELLGKEVLGPLRHPEIHEKYRIGVPNGILFYGPPGCGKTYIARQLAEELGYFFQEMRPSDVGSPFIHGTVMRIRELFDIAVERAPSVVFIDELDAFVPSRSDLGGFQQYKSEEVNEFLATLESCAARRVLVIAATNVPEKIDPAVRRTGRFDKLIYIPAPDADARLAMLQFHLLDRPVEAEIDLRGVATVLDGYSASDLKFLVEEAARVALGNEVPISTQMLLDVLRRVPPSITPEDEARFQTFGSRGV